nr:hypothetical protein [Pantoea sp. 201603H]
MNINSLSSMLNDFLSHHNGAAGVFGHAMHDAKPGHIHGTVPGTQPQGGMIPGDPGHPTHGTIPGNMPHGALWDTLHKAAGKEHGAPVHF